MLFPCYAAMVLCLTSTLVTCLQCQEGALFLSEHGDDSTFSTEKCSEAGHICQRMEAAVSVFGAINVTIISTECGNSSVCDATACSGLSEILYSGIGSGSGSTLEYEINTCDVACCYDDNCNEDLIDTIRESNALWTSDVFLEESEATTHGGQANHIGSADTLLVLAMLSTLTIALALT